MKKIFIFVFSISLLLCLFGCNKTKEETLFEEAYTAKRITDLSKELESKITNAYKNNNETYIEYQLVIDDCYLFDDGLCMFFIHGLYNTYFYNISEDVAGYKFIYPNSNNLLVLYNDSILSMTEAFNQQVINEARVKSLFSLYKTQYENLYNDNVKSLDYNLLLEIKNEYALKNNIKELDNITVSNYFGTYNDAVVLMISEGGYFPSITIETVDGIEFRYPNSIKISVYKNKLFYDLNKAFEDNLVTHNELVEINKLFNE